MIRNIILGRRQLRFLEILKDGKEHKLTHFVDAGRGWEFSRVCLDNFREQGLAVDLSRPRELWTTKKYRWYITTRGLIALGKGYYKRFPREFMVRYRSISSGLRVTRRVRVKESWYDERLEKMLFVCTTKDDGEISIDEGEITAL